MSLIFVQKNFYHKRKKKHIIYNTLKSVLDIENLLVLDDHQLL